MLNLKEVKFTSIKFKIFSCFISVIIALVIMSAAGQFIYNNNLNKYKNLISSMQNEMELMDSCIDDCSKLLVILDKPESKERFDEIDRNIKQLEGNVQALAKSSSVKNNAKDFILSTLERFVNQLKEANDASSMNKTELSTLFYSKAQEDIRLLKESSNSLIKANLIEYSSGMRKDIDSIINITQIVLILAWLLVLGIGLFITYKIVNSITGGLKTLTEASEVMSSGNLSGDDVVIESNDELEIMSKAFNHMKTSLNDIVKNVTVISYSIFVAARNLSKSIEEHFEVSRQVSIAIENMAKDAESQMLSVKATSDSLAKIIGPKKPAEHDIDTILKNMSSIHEAVHNISGITERFAACTEEISAASEEQVDKFKDMLTISEKLDANSEQLEKLIQHFKVSAN